jgi:tRNA pseudouridine38-40 synthase
MPRYFIEVAYNGKNYSGFQRQQNSNTIQAETEKVISLLARKEIMLTGSSRTDAGVHALQNYFHFDSGNTIQEWEGIVNAERLVYKLNAILPEDICVKKIIEVNDTAHCRFDAINREYKYYIYRHKDPFLQDRSFYFPYKLDIEKLDTTALMLKECTDFTSFSKRNTQVKSFDCIIYESKWIKEDKQIIYYVKANRFLRGMVRALVATQLKVGRGKLSIAEFKQIIQSAKSATAFFSAPARGLFLEAVNFPLDYFTKQIAT